MFKKKKDTVLKINALNVETLKNEDGRSTIVANIKGSTLSFINCIRLGVYVYVASQIYMDF